MAEVGIGSWFIMLNGVNWYLGLGFLGVCQQSIMVHRGVDKYRRNKTNSIGL